MMIKSAGAICCLCFAAASGCNSSYDGLIPVSGKVTFDGGPPPAAGFVTFIPIERVEGRASRPARAVFQADGAFQATSFQEGDGIFPGRYNVLVSCNKGDLDYSKKDPFRDVSYLANDYDGQELVVEPDSDEITLDLDVPLKKG